MATLPFQNLTRALAEHNGERRFQNQLNVESTEMFAQLEVLIQGLNGGASVKTFVAIRINTSEQERLLQCHVLNIQQFT